MTKIRTLVVDDEPVARAHVLALLREEDDIEIVGECGNGAEAVATIEDASPDLLCLDIQMPELNGLDLARALPPDHVPAIVIHHRL